MGKNLHILGDLNSVNVLCKCKEDSQVETEFFLHTSNGLSSVLMQREREVSGVSSYKDTSLIRSGYPIMTPLTLIT